MSTLNVYTSGDIARMLSAKPVTVQHILHSRSHIKPQQRLGITRLYDWDAVKLVEAELTKMRTSTRPATATTTEGQSDGKDT